MSDDYTQENTTERERLFRLTAELSEADLALPLAKGWSVATKLLHLAFWDQYCLALLNQWKHTAPSTSTMDVDAVNEAVRVLSTAVPAGAIIQLVRTAAEAVDREAARITPELRETIEKAGRGRVVRRFIHRRAHLDQIETALKT
jgi:hypothetical protein